MGANDKKRAVSNTWPQIPETADIRDAWIRSETADNPFDQLADIEAEFDCWLEQVKAEAKAEALTEYAETLEDLLSTKYRLLGNPRLGVPAIIRKLRERAEQIRSDP